MTALRPEALGGDDETPMHQLLGSSVTYRISVHHPAYRWDCWIEELNTMTTQICCFHFGNGMIGLIPGSEIGEKPNIFRQCLGLNTQP